MFNTKGEVKKVGSYITVTDGKMRVSDTHNWKGLRTAKVKVKNGDWVCYMFVENKCPTALLIVHEDLLPYLDGFGLHNHCIMDMEHLGTIDVESGMAGFFPAKNRDWTEEEWDYVIDAIVKYTCVKTDNSFFSQTYAGDGSYNVYGWVGKNNTALGLCLKFA